MTPEECTVALEELWDLYGLKGEDRMTQSRILQKTCGNWSVERFREVCQSLLENAKAYRPKPGDFKEAYRTIGLEKGWFDVKPRAGCAKCYGTGFETQYARRLSDESVHQLSVPCLDCNRQRTALPKGWVAVTEREWAEAQHPHFFEDWKFGKGLAEAYRKGQVSYDAALAQVVPAQVAANRRAREATRIGAHIVAALTAGAVPEPEPEPEP